MLNKLALAEERFEEICQMLYDPAVIADLEQYSALLKEHKNLEPIITKFREYKAADETLKESRAMLDEGGRLLTMYLAVSNIRSQLRVRIRNRNLEHFRFANGSGGDHTPQL